MITAIATIIIAISSGFVMTIQSLALTGYRSITCCKNKCTAQQPDERPTVVIINPFNPENNGLVFSPR